jgi:hypothetical protein
MHIEQVEIYDDSTNAAVMRHPGRKFPGLLFQGDSLCALCQQADEVCDAFSSHKGSDAWEEINDLRNRLWDALNLYKDALDRHDIPLPFSQDARF